MPKRLTRAVILVVGLILFAGTAYSQDYNQALRAGGVGQIPGVDPVGSMMKADQAMQLRMRTQMMQMELERRQIELERQRLELQRQQIQVQQMQQKQ